MCLAIHVDMHFCFAAASTQQQSCLMISHTEPTLRAKYNHSRYLDILDA